MSKTSPQKRIEYILKELLKHKCHVMNSNSVHSSGYLYDDVVEDIEDYLKSCKEPS